MVEVGSTVEVGGTVEAGGTGKVDSGVEVEE